MSEYRIGQKVEAVAERVLPFGVFVRLDNDTKAYIRRRELDLDADVDPSQVVHEGDRFEAIILDLGKRRKLIELSRRATLDDPWPRFARLHHVGDVIRGEVCALRPSGVFIRIQPGIDGFVSLVELAPKPVEKPEEVLWKGDRVEAVISSITLSKKHLSLSIKARLHQYDQALKIAADISTKPTTKRKTSRSFHRVDETSEKSKGIDYQQAGPILIVEDNDQVRESLKTWLSKKGIQVSVATSIQEATKSLSTSHRTLLIDLHLKDDDGLELIRQLRQSDRRGIICVMSSPDILAERAGEIQAAEVAQVFAKPLDMEEIETFLSQVAQNKPLPLWRADISESVAKEAADMFGPPEIRSDTQVQSVLREMTEMMQAQSGILFWLDPTSKAVSIQAQIGEDRLNPNAIYGLHESPVRDVIQNGDTVFENYVTTRARAKFDKLLDMLAFESCIGVPVHVFNEVNHAAFFFHAEENAFSRYRLRDARAGSLLLSAVLVNQLIRKQMGSLNPMLMSGELAASFGHDVFNKITALELEALNMIDMDADNRSRSQRILDLVLDLKGTVQAFQELLKKKEQIEAINVNEVVERALPLLRSFARRENTSIVLKLAPKPPTIVGNAIFLQQTFLNIMLNAIQQMALKAEKYGWDGKRTLEISSSVEDAWLQVRFKDNGPGIHREHLDRLFAPGFSTRSGSGLGLYIALNFIQALGGRLVVEETIVPLGTTFLVKLPLGKQEKVV
jgi:signal transduction histidine kinase/predicted RNA-binding protein with RPS1 domain/DNA-binding NarL/FixJ family response regulator